MKTHGVVEVQTYTSLPSWLDGESLSSSYRGHIISLEKLPTEYETAWAWLDIDRLVEIKTSSFWRVSTKFGPLLYSDLLDFPFKETVCYPVLNWKRFSECDVKIRVLQESQEGSASPRGYAAGYDKNVSYIANNANTSNKRLNPSRLLL